MKDNNRTRTNNQERAETFINNLAGITQNFDTSDLALKAIKKYENTQVSSVKREDEEQQHVIFFYLCY